uniref:Uncharacterized protein n=1 Tax=Kalanchoe fedtschenkoi TaxID=63787 RepID=A0A7N0V8I4_KALFE
MCDEKMEDNNEPTLTSNFIVNITNKSVVKASTPPLPDPHILAVSNLDLLSGRFPVTYLYFYLPVNIGHVTFESAVTSLKASLSETLTHFYPFAGRIVHNDNTGEPEIFCDNSGALVLEASADVRLREVDLCNLGSILQGKLVASLAQLDSHPMQVQVTKYACGGLSLTFTFDHLLGDASAFGKFLTSWSEVARCKTMSCVPDHNRQRLKARCPPTYHRSLDRTFVKCTLLEIDNIPTSTALVKRLYHIDASSRGSASGAGVVGRGDEED